MVNSLTGRQLPAVVQLVYLTASITEMTQPEKIPTRIQQQNQQRIRQAALSVFSRYGYRGGRVEQIAREAGMSKANLLYYYNRKQDIYLSVLGHILELWLAPLATLDPEGDPCEQLWQYTQEKLSLSRTNPEASRLFANEIIEGAPVLRNFLETELKQQVDEKCRVIQYWIDQGRLAPVAPPHLLFLIWATTQHYADFRSQIDCVLESNEAQIFSDAEKTLKTVLKGLTGGLETPIT